jgi:DNA mismatch repair protein MutL
MKGYGNSLAQGKFPACVISVEVDRAEVDVNIHPRKEEVAFLHPRVVENAITQAVKKTLEQAVSEGLKRSVTTHANFYFPEQENKFKDVHLNTGMGKQYFGPKIPEHIPLPPADAYAGRGYEVPATAVSGLRQSAEEKIKDDSFSAADFDFSEEQPTLSTQTKIQSDNSNTVQAHAFGTNAAQEHIFDVLGCYHNTYILLNTQEGLMLVDQHAAHERILYEKFLTHFEHVPVVGNLFPTIVQLSIEDVRMLEPHLGLLHKHGIMAEIFGDSQVVITATPVTCKGVALDDVVRQIIGWISELQNIDSREFGKILHEKIHAQMACKTAVKAGDVLTREQMMQLVTDLFRTNNRFSCPHGRPTTWLVSLNEIERKFRRKLQGI